MFWLIMGSINIAAAIILGPLFGIIGGDPDWGQAVFSLIVGIWLLEGGE